MKPTEVARVLVRVLGCAQALEGDGRLDAFALPGGGFVERASGGWRIGAEIVTDPEALEAAVRRSIPCLPGLDAYAAAWLHGAAHPQGASLRDASVLDAVVIRELKAIGLVEHIEDRRRIRATSAGHALLAAPQIPEGP